MNFITKQHKKKTYNKNFIACNFPEISINFYIISFLLNSIFNDNYNFSFLGKFLQ